MKDFIRITDLTQNDIDTIFQLADDLCDGKDAGSLQGKSIALFFPESSIRTRVTFEKGIH